MLEYGEMKVVRFTFDAEDKKLAIQVKQEIIEDGVVIDHIFPQVLARNDDFAEALERLMPAASGVISKMETEGKLIISEQRSKMKEEKAKKVDAMGLGKDIHAGASK